MSKMDKITQKILLCFVVFIVVFFVIGIGSLFYNSYKSRIPIYQTVMTDFELLVGPPEGRSDGSYSEMQHELQDFIDKFEIKTLHCFVFHDPHRATNYGILLVGTLPEEADFSEYTLEKHPLKSHPWLFSALNLCGTEPKENEEYLELLYCFFDYRVFTYHNRIIFEKATINPTALRRDDEKRKFLEQYIVPRKKHGRDSAESANEQV
jgi:hypothetical protein